MAERTAKDLVVELLYGPETETLHPEDRAAAESLIDQVEAAGWRVVPAELLTAVQRLTEEVYVPHHTPSSESGPEEWDVELLAPESETVEAVIRHLIRLAARPVVVTTNAHDTPDEVRASGWVAPTSVGGTDG